MRLPSGASAFVLIFVLHSAPLRAAPVSALSPCKSQICLVGDESAKRLNDAYFSVLTSDSQRQKISEIIAQHTVGEKIDWSAAAKEYFAWRAAEEGYQEPPAGLPSKSFAQAEAEELKNAPARDLAEQRAFREAAEAGLRGRLIDPDSAQFEWPYKFVWGYWKPFLSKRVNGYVTCGTVNARNRMGGYAGRSAFVVVLDERKNVVLANIDSGKYEILAGQCEKAAATFLPPADPEVATAPPSSVGSVADEIEKLANLRDRGVITEAEFDTQKARLLGERQ
jgi:hypothetical protein